MKKFVIAIMLITQCLSSKGQFLMDMTDTSKAIGKGLLTIYKKYDWLTLSGYIQPQFQAASQKAAKGYSGGDFAPNVNNRFMLRRGRLKMDYYHIGDGATPSIQFVLQLDGTERGVFARDIWGKVSENRYKLFSLTMGLFSRPFGYEVNLSSGDRESPERGRMSQILMKTERDLGAMLSFEPRKKGHPLQYLGIYAGFFNGPGLTAPADYDSHKDFIGRIALRPYPLTQKLTLSMAGSYFNGGFLQNSKYVYHIRTTDNQKLFLIDSLLANKGRIAPRKYYGADIQLKFKHKKCITELRAEYISGQQTSSENTTETPAVLLKNEDAYYVRSFNGAYFCFLQQIVNPRHQIVIKYDWYDPNTDVRKNDIGKAGANINMANIKYSTLGFGYIHYVTENLKFVFWYDRIKNEKTQLAGFTGDVSDDVFTCRMQFKF